MSGGTVHGTCEPRYERVRSVFAEHFETGVEVGASFAVVHRGRTVVDLWGGHADAARTRPWRDDTIVNVYSTTKGVVALLVALLVQEGRLAYDAPVGRYWPGFATNGKQDVTVAMILSHRAGLCAVDPPLLTHDLYDWAGMTGILERAAPLWPPGTRTGYHARTYGFLAGELIRRVTGRGVGAFLRERLAGPLDADMFIGVPASETARVADIVGPASLVPDDGPGEETRLAERMGPVLAGMMGTDVRSGAQEPPPPDVLAMMERVFTNPVNPPESANDPGWRAAEIPSSNGHANARALARIYGAVAWGSDGRPPLLGPATVAEATLVEGDPFDGVLGFPVRWGRGFTMNGGEFGPRPDAFGHRGIGGSFAYVDPAEGMGVGYAMNQWIPKFGDNPGNDPRADRLVRALYGCL
ncbi:beta-lactamase family protein [Micromonospora sp. NBC_01655]|uniref:serine hydrolase domain-containing protein n=1 Tax=Micromonospora sp. NBC_01655 TaxID=2975983 RepID=UPI002250430D|nr:serine hydrolase domain-containing protein [Micromonospora sp. NBC_01655]MCX4474623.1 beta-lactamase family protein [Micromonospora sp. NBC_01655]